MPHVCMVIEGAYPYITGGVSAWCHQLITEISDVNFTLLVILPASYRGKEYKYEIPDNVLEIQEVWLDLNYFDESQASSSKKERESLFDEIIEFHTSMKLKNYGFFKIITEIFSENESPPFNLEDLTKSKEAVNSLFEIYKETSNNSSFMPYFWTWKSTHLPLFRTINAPLPRADLYHAVSTGYAGFLTALAKLRYDIPFILTEHGIYAMEREDELKDSELIDDEQKHLWIQFFHSLCRISYSFADKIITLYRGNQFIEVANNANVDKTEIIPNGVDIELYSSLQKVTSPERIVVGTVVRVVPIKDVKTFIKAAAIVSKEVPNAEFHIIGPTDEDEDYFDECEKLVEEFNLQDKLIFTGRVTMTDYYPKIDILVLTSAREAQPLVLLEGMCVGMPCVSSDVGSCREMLDGIGFITTPGSPEETAEAIIKLCNNKGLREELIVKGKELVISRFNVKDVIESYRQIYFKYSKQTKTNLMDKNGRNRIPTA